MAKFLKPLQSEGGFSVAEESIIDPQRNILKANSIEVVNNTFTDAFKKEFISFNTATDISSTVNLEPFSDVSSNNIIFSKANILLSWKGYVIAQYSVNANSSIATVTLDNHGLSIGSNVTLLFDTQGTESNGTYPVLNIINNSVFTVDTGIVFNPSQSIVNGTVEITSYGLYWEYSLEIITTCLSDSSNNLTLAGVSKTVLKDNIPVGHIWNVFPTVNNTLKTFGYQVQISTNGTLESQANGVECSAFITNVSSVRD
jgi:hypothetical protein